MWLDNLKELKADTKMTAKQIAEKANLPEKTVIRILSGKNTPYLDTLDRIATALGATIGDILAGTKAVVADTTLPALQEELAAAQAALETKSAEMDLLATAQAVLKAENEALQKQVDAQAAKIDLLQMQLMHKEELLAVHNYYIKKQSQ